MRLRVRLDIRDPLKIEKKIKRLNGDWLLVKFRYERLPNFCYICGCMGHIDRHCEIYFKLPDDKIVCLWDKTLLAPPKLSTLGGERWLVEDSDDEPDKVLKEHDMNIVGKPSNKNCALLANLRALRDTQTLNLEDFYSSKGREQVPLLIADDRKRPREAGDDCMEVEITGRKNSSGG
ncbi:hypothetical protein LINPERHAP1_LOCUS16092 [Linum perenne]